MLDKQVKWMGVVLELLSQSTYIPFPIPSPPCPAIATYIARPPLP